MTAKAALAVLLSALIASPGWAGSADDPDAAAMFFGVTLDGLPIEGDRLQGLQQRLGLQPTLVVFFQQWPGLERLESGAFPRSSIEAIDASGALACVTWEPMTFAGGVEQAIPAAVILGGEYDDYIRRYARAARDYGKPLLIRFAHEMNLSRYHWGTDAAGYGPLTPALYKSMYRYVVERFREEGADNVGFVFCPNAESVPHPEWDSDADWNRADAYFPGADVVDVLGIDGYNWGTTQTLERDGWDSHFRSFAEVIGPMFETLRSLSPETPIAVFETASASEGGDKTAWVKAAVDSMQSWGIAGFSWFEVDKEVDWRLLTGTDEGLSDWLRMRTGADARTKLLTKIRGR
jgi:hypothetical protein